MSQESRPVFFDPTRRRAVWVQRLGLIFLVIALALLTVFAASVLTVPLTGTPLKKPHFLPDNATRRGNAPVPPSPAQLPTEPRKSPIANPLGTGVPGRGAGVVGGFYVDWDETSIASLKGHASQLTHLFPGWLHLNDSGSGLITTDSDPTDQEAREIARQNHIAVLPLLNNYSDNIKDFDGKRLHAMLASPEKRAAVVDALTEYVTRHRYAGVNIDLETDSDDDRVRLATFVAEVGARFHPKGLLMTACTQVGEPRQAEEIARHCDFVVPMIYDEHWATGEAGPIASQRWFEEELDRFLESVPADKCVVAIGNYAYDWVHGKHEAKTLTFGEAMATADESKDGSDGIVRFDRASKNPTFTYEEDGERHDVWLLDAPVAYNFLRYARTKGISGRALWYVGSEDPTLWSIFGKGTTPDATELLTTMRYPFVMDFEGEGEVLDVIAQPKDGHRTLVLDNDGTITGETFTAYPTQCLVRRSGKAEKKIALTFDDGPDPRWTPLVLDALEKAKVKATFFVCGVNVEQHMDLVRRAYLAGHDIGNHSFFHPNLADVTPQRLRLELDTTERAIQAAIGHATMLFRPPYGVDSQPRTYQEMIPVAAAHELGYVTVAEGIDPRDWESGSKKRTAKQIATQIVEEATSGAHADGRWRGNIVLLHDSGGDRAATVAAIGLATEQLKAAGYQFVTVSELLGLPRNTAFPPLTGRQKWLAAVDFGVFFLSAWGGKFLAAIFLFSLFAGALRMIATAILAVRGATLDPPTYPEQSGAPRLASVCMAAYNEEAVIARTIATVLSSDYPNLEVIVVDDGSKDGTVAVVQSQFGSDARVRLLTKENGGKASALNHAIAEARGEILIGIDADTLFLPNTISQLMRHFDDPTLDAVAGNIQVGNRSTLWTRFQAVEYTTSQNFDRRAYSVLNGIPVVPGCVGAWRKTAVLEAGGYTTDTLAEDADLTWRIRKRGGRIVTDNDARAFTEAPEHLQDLMKQRFRWTFGTLQVLVKHHDVVFDRRYGWFGVLVVPSLWVFQLGLPLLAPLADLGIAMAAFFGNLTTAGVYFAFFFALELAAALLAFHLDDAEPARRRDLLLLPLQRILWRYVLFFVLIRSVVQAIQGARAGWGKLRRTNTASVGKPG